MQLSFERDYTSYISNFFLSAHVVIFCILLLNKDDKGWVLYTTIFTYLCLFSLMIGGIKWGRSLLSGARIFHQMQTPVCLWHRWQQAILKRASLHFFVLFCTISLLELSHESLFSTSALLALISFSVTLGFYLPLLLNKYLNKPSYFLLIIVTLYLTYIATNIGLKKYLEETWLWHLPVILLWPLLVASILLFWDKPPTPKSTSLLLQLKNLRLIDAIYQFHQRFTNLDLVSARQKAGRLPVSDKVLKTIGLMWFLFFSQMLVVEWNAPVTLPHLIFLVAISAFSSSYIVVKDLHWRYLLLPKKFRPGRIANHLLMSNLMYYGYWALLLLITVQVCKAVLFGQVTSNHVVPSTTPIVISNIAIFIIELITAFCIGLAIRASKKPARNFFYLFLLSLFIAACATTMFYFQKQDPIKAAVFTMNTAYVSGLVIMCSSALFIGNKLWTRERLLAFV